MSHLQTIHQEYLVLHKIKFAYSEHVLSLDWILALLRGLLQKPEYIQFASMIVWKFDPQYSAQTFISKLCVKYLPKYAISKDMGKIFLTLPYLQRVKSISTM